jgi:lysozyme
MSRLKKGGAIAALCCAVVGGFEGIRQVAYRDVVGVPTVCYGETRGIRMGMKFTKTECDAMLLKGLDEFANGVERCVPSAVNMPEARYVAHVSLAYNIGIGAYCKSTVARRANAGDVRGSCDAFMMWNKAKGITFPGLTRRRAHERAMCLKGTA